MPAGVCGAGPALAQRDGCAADDPHPRHRPEVGRAANQPSRSFSITNKAPLLKALISAYTVKSLLRQMINRHLNIDMILGRRCKDHNRCPSWWLWKYREGLFTVLYHTLYYCIRIRLKYVHAREICSRVRIRRYHTDHHRTHPSCDHYTLAQLSVWTHHCAHSKCHCSTSHLHLQFSHWNLHILTWHRINTSSNKGGNMWTRIGHELDRRMNVKCVNAQIETLLASCRTSLLRILSLSKLFSAKTELFRNHLLRSLVK